ncbi:DUF4159 domain-containing protein [Mariniblastus fucicola]|uniref:DUF4159 domain-containing protein n=1 Tax=Mariniblastus fucicola TaxID=980251 RepID=A0A5B9P848_9BACT|nr:DUF4159 domain-containing protein [Mariniblastus fucicola]QEG22468.1 hypothetical protein MFFC18_23480 [Mariniblastus fucicola]
MIEYLHFHKRRSTVLLALLTALSVCCNGDALAQTTTGEVKCANLIYARNKTSVCFSSDFMDDINNKTNIRTDGKFSPVRLEDENLFDYPFSVMTGEGNFKLSQSQQESLKNYLTGGGFVVASAGCSDGSWASSCRKELNGLFPENKMKKLEMDHPIFHSFYDIKRLNSARKDLEGLEIDGKIVLVFSSDGLNDSDNAEDESCCCCGGNEIDNARQININLLIYALTH